MKITPISGDMAVKLALGAGIIVGVWYLWQKVAQVGGIVADTTQHVIDATVEAAHQVSPTNNENIIYTGVNRMTGGSDDNPLGGRIYDYFHPWN